MTPRTESIHHHKEDQMGENEYGLIPPQVRSMAEQARDIAALANALAGALDDGQFQRLAGRLERLMNDSAYLASYVGARTREQEYKELQALNTRELADMVRTDA
jgi:hypothetical protein